ncbi:SH3 domain-binding protein 1-like [Equus przewalskii]|uniref:SH3 domain-binding protein 1-like n=1 Tax=Equus przewalskii TaxID=9798 RepID=A0ABM4KIJ2_EQUPR
MSIATILVPAVTILLLDCCKNLRTSRAIGKQLVPSRREILGWVLFSQVGGSAGLRAPRLFVEVEGVSAFPRLPCPQPRPERFVTYSARNSSRGENGFQLPPRYTIVSPGRDGPAAPRRPGPRAGSGQGLLGAPLLPAEARPARALLSVSSSRRTPPPAAAARPSRAGPRAARASPGRRLGRCPGPEPGRVRRTPEALAEPGSGIPDPLSSSPQALEVGWGSRYHRLHFTAAETE